MDTPTNPMRRGRLPDIGPSSRPRAWATFKERSGRTSTRGDTSSIIMSPGQYRRPEHQGKAGRHASHPFAQPRVIHQTRGDNTPHQPNTGTGRRNTTSLPRPSRPESPTPWLTASRSVADATGLRPALDPGPSTRRNPAALRSKEKDRTNTATTQAQPHRNRSFHPFGPGVSHQVRPTLVDMPSACRLTCRLRRCDPG
jgi:hypothetical protein